MDMPDNSNPKMKHALFFHRNKKSSSHQYKQKPDKHTTYLRGKKQRNSSFLSKFLAREDRGDDERNAIGTKDRTPSFARNPVGEDDVRLVTGIRYRAESPRITRDVCSGQLIFPRARKETKYIWSVDLPLGKEGNKICGQLICPGVVNT